MGSVGSAAALRPTLPPPPEGSRAAGQLTDGYLTGGHLAAGRLTGLRTWPTRPDRPIRAHNSVWLAAVLDQLWEDHFWDVPRISPVEIRFGGRWKYRLARIRWEPVAQTTLIAINALFRDPAVPETLCRVTIAHEIIHYAHGFGSPLPRAYDDPHESGLIEGELEARGLGRELALADAWVERHWLDFYARASRRATTEEPPELR